ncbi:MAG: PD-(D/E)XK nuclease family protein [Acidobacteriota bacterium]
MAALANEFSWSRSRDGAFNECRRRYWFQYYGFWGGWEAAADPETRDIYQLRQLKSRQMWAGEVVHSCIQRSLENLRGGIEPLPLEEIVSLALDRMRNEWRQSRDGVYRSRPKTTALFEHEYAVPLSDEQWRANAEHVASCLRTFYRSDTYAWIRSLPRERWLEIEEFSCFHLDGVKVHVRLDFACREGDRVHILDWKTGRRDEEDNSVQLACYALYAHQKWGTLPRDLRTAELNLARGQLREYPVSAAQIERTRGYIRGSIRDMRALLLDPEAGNAVDRESCPLTADLWRCRNCNFRRLCGR